MIKILKNPTREEIKTFECFADKNWGEHSEGGDTKLDFYDYHRMIFENYIGEVLVSGLVVFFKSTMLSKRVVQFAGIGGVVTHIDYRHQGLALETLKYSLAELKKMGIGIAMLCTEVEKLGPLYKKAGFKPLDKPYSFIDKDGKRKSEKGGMIVNLGDTKAFEYLHKTQEEIFVGLSNF